MSCDQSRIVSSVSELALNVVHHADEGTVLVEPVNREGRQGIRMAVRILGPGWKKRNKSSECRRLRQWWKDMDFAKSGI